LHKQKQLKMNLNEKTILITGGTSGIGLEFVKQLSQHGVAQIILTGRDAAKLERLKDQFPKVHTIQSDVSDPRHIEHLYLEVTQKFGAVHVLINNAGIMRNLNVRNTGSDLEDITREIDTNLSGTIRMVQQFLPHLSAQPSAAIVNVSSGLAFIPFPLSPVYSAAKAGVHAYTRVLRLQLKKTNIKVFEVAPPSTETPLQDAFSNVDLGSSAPMMKVDKVVSEAIKGILNDQLEILPGMSKTMKLMGRLAPKFFLNFMDRTIEKAINKSK
jgi:uncharacterized oxidoreductase